MLSIFCFANILKYKTYSLNTLFGCAFLMLIWNPLWLFDIGFQLSFCAVFSMMTILPKISKFTYNQPKVAKYFIDIFIVSLVVQIGTLPLCLYYFGTFPLYFFIANLFVIPLITLLIYASLVTLIVSIPALLVPAISDTLYFLPLKVISFLTTCLIKTTSFFENLPYAVFDDLKIGIISIFLLWISFYSIIIFIRNSKPIFLTTALSAAFILISSGIYSLYQKKNSLIASADNRNNQITYYIGFTKQQVETKHMNKLIDLHGKTYLLLNEDKWKNAQKVLMKKDINFLHISSDGPISLISLSRIFNIKKV